jgi:hypothetical protein
MRKQRAFATLTDAEIEQIAQWLRLEKYDTVRERLAKPRPEGFGLIVSNKPLQLLFRKTNLVARINEKIATGEKLTLSEFEKISAGEKPDLAENIHDAILETVHDLAKSAVASPESTTPHKLLALQQLADFPARAELRAQRAEHQAEMHQHKLEMIAHRQYIGQERLSLAKRSIDLRERRLAPPSELVGPPQTRLVPRANVISTIDFAGNPLLCPEGTLDTSPAASAPGTPASKTLSPAGTAENASVSIIALSRCARNASCEKSKIAFP